MTKIAKSCAPWKGGRFGGKSLVRRFLEIPGYAYPELRHEDGLHSVLMRKHELQLELQWFIDSNGGRWFVCGVENDDREHQFCHPVSL